MKAYLHLIKYALSNGAAVSVFDTEEWSLIKSSSYNEIKKEIEDLEECTVRIVIGDKWQGNAIITPFEDPETTVCDYNDTPFMNEWQKQYDADQA